MAPVARPNVADALRRREQGRMAPAAFRAAAHAAAVPSHAFLAVRRAPPAVLRRYTPCGRFLVAVDRNRTDLRLYRLETGGWRAAAPAAAAAAAAAAAEPAPAAPGDGVPPRGVAARAAAAARAAGAAHADADAASFAARPLLQNPARAAGGGDVGGGGAGEARRRARRQGGGVEALTAAGGNPFRAPPPPLAGGGSDAGAAALRAFNRNPLAPGTGAGYGGGGGLGGGAGHVVGPSGLLSSLPIPPARPPPSPPPAPPVDYSRHSCDFSRFFTHMYTVPVAAGAEVLVPDFCLATRSHLILASVVVPIPHLGADALPPAAPPAVAGVRVVYDRVSLNLVDTETGEVRDKYVLHEDYVALEGHAGVHMFGETLCVLSIRHQTLHVLRVNDAAGRLVPVSRIGAHCNPDDELEIARSRDAELRHSSLGRDGCGAATASGGARGGRRRASGGATPNGAGPAGGGADGGGGGDDGVENGEGAEEDDGWATDRVAETGLGNGKGARGFYSGLMHRLLVHVYNQHSHERNERLFFRVVGQYSMLVMKKAQLLDSDHLLIRLGSSGMLDPRASTCFFLVYCVSTARVVNLYENRSAELLELYEQHGDLFTADPAVAAILPPVRAAAFSGADGARRGGSAGAGAAGAAGGSASRVAQGRTREILAELPVSAQDRNASVYLSRRLFSYALDRLPALDGRRALSMREVNSVRFTAAGGGTLRFKLTPGLPNGEAAPDGSGGPRTARRKALFLFHPTLPFVISMQASQSMPTSPLINFHVRDG